MPAKIVICGNYGADNLGDELILFSILKGIHTKYPESDITVLSANPNQTKERYKIKALPLMPAGVRSFFKFKFLKTVEAVKKTDLFILGGGGLFTDEKLHAVFIWYIQAFTASLFKRKIYIFANSIGPLNTRIGKYFTGKALKKAAIITVRDKRSLEEIQKLDIGDNKTIVTADPVFILRSLDSFAEANSLGMTGGEANSLVLKTESAGMKEILPGITEKMLGLHTTNRKSTVLISLRPFLNLTDKLVEIMPDFINFLIKERGIKVKFLPFETGKNNDLELYDKIIEKCSESSRDKFEILDPSFDFNKIVQIFNNIDFVIGMRFHSLVLAAITNKPFISLSYSQKNSAFLEDINFREADIKPNDFKLEIFKKKFDFINKNYLKIQKQLKNAEINQRRKSGINFEYI